MIPQSTYYDHQKLIPARNQHVPVTQEFAQRFGSALKVPNTSPPISSTSGKHPRDVRMSVTMLLS